MVRRRAWSRALRSRGASPSLPVPLGAEATRRLSLARGAEATHEEHAAAHPRRDPLSGSAPRCRAWLSIWALHPHARHPARGPGLGGPDRPPGLLPHHLRRARLGGVPCHGLPRRRCVGAHSSLHERRADLAQRRWSSIGTPHMPTWPRSAAPTCSRERVTDRRERPRRPRWRTSARAPWTCALRLSRPSSGSRTPATPTISSSPVRRSLRVVLAASRCSSRPSSTTKASHASYGRTRSLHASRVRADTFASESPRRLASYETPSSLFMLASSAGVNGYWSNSALATHLKALTARGSRVSARRVHS